MQAVQIEEAAKVLLTARIEGTVLQELPASCRPLTDSDAYAIQSRLIRLTDSPVVGWKVGATSPASRKLLGTEQPFSGCLIASGVARTPETTARRALRSPFVEAEYAFVLRAIGAGAPVDASTVFHHVKSVRLAIEICQTRFATLTAPGVPSLIADNAVAAYLVLGPEIVDWQRSDLTDREVTMSINGERKATGNGRAVLEDPIHALCWVISDRRSRGEQVPEDFIVSSGSCTGMAPANPGDLVEASFAGLGTVEVRL